MQNVRRLSQDQLARWNRGLLTNHDRRIEKQSGGFGAIHWLRNLRPTCHKIGRFVDVLPTPSQSLGVDRTEGFGANEQSSATIRVRTALRWVSWRGNGQRRQTWTSCPHDSHVWRRWLGRQVDGRLVLVRPDGQLWRRRHCARCRTRSETFTQCKHVSPQTVGWLEFNVPSQHKYGYIRDERSGWRVILLPSEGRLAIY